MPQGERVREAISISITIPPISLKVFRNEIGFNREGQRCESTNTLKSIAEKIV